MNNKKKRKIIINNKKRFVLLLSSLFLIFIIILFSGILYFIKYQIVFPLDKNATEKEFVIQKGDGLKKIANNLEQEKIIRNDIWFNLYVFYKGWAAHLQAGEYSLGPNLNIIEIAEKIFKGDAISNNFKITIPEGFNLRQIDAKLTEVGLIKSGELSSQSQLEGYLFPDTYEFNKEMNLNEIVDIMKSNFNKKIDNLKSEIERQEKTIEEIIIMASLIEKEVSSYEDRQIVSGIFWKRLNINYPLQSCATVAYALGKDKWIYSFEDTKVNSPYNTYENIGLPPGPICNPGISAIKAAVYPTTTDYYFFLSKPNGETVFSETFEEHQENIVKYLN